MSFQTRDHHGVVYHTSSILDTPGLIHGFSTRLGGVSEGPFASLNFRGGGPEPDVRENVRENYRRFCEALGTDVHNVVQSHQVHEDTVRHVTGADRGKGLFAATDYTADALVTDEPGLSLMVFSADCIILLLHDPVTASIGAVHAGWRGTALGIAARAVETMERIVPEIGAREFIVDEDIAKVSLVGTGMKSSPGVASRTFQTLGDNNINIVAISTSPIRLSMIVDAAQAAQAVQCLHTAFGLDSDDLFVETQLSAEEIAAKMKKGR